MKNLAFFILIAVLASCATQQSRTYLGYKVVEMPFVTAGGEVVNLPTTDAGPIPAEGNGFKVEVAGFSVGKSSEKEKTAELIWQFAVSTANGAKVKEISIEEVAPSEVVVPLVLEENPTFSDGIWRDSLNPIEVNPTNTPFLFNNSASIYVFRVTIKVENQQSIVLYQPAWFSAQAKSTYQQMIARIQNG